MGDVIFDNRRFSDFGVIVSGENTWAQPTRRVTKAQVPGKNGDLIVEAGEFNNVEISYPAGIMHDFDSDEPGGWEMFSNFLLSRSDAYYRLEDEYHPLYYRMARFVPGIAPKVGTLNRSGQFSVAFDCKPQKYLLSGEDEYVITEAYTPLRLENPTRYRAYPEIELVPYVTLDFEVHDSGGDLLTDGTEAVTLEIDDSDIPSGARDVKFTYYTEQREVVMEYFISGVTVREYVTDKLVVGTIGTNGLSFPGGNTYAIISLGTSDESPSDVTTKIKPRWYTI